MGAERGARVAALGQRGPASAARLPIRSQVQSYKKKIRQLEDDLLFRLSNSQGNLLDDTGGQGRGRKGQRLRRGACFGLSGRAGGVPLRALLLFVCMAGA